MQRFLSAIARRAVAAAVAVAASALIAMTLAAIPAAHAQQPPAKPALETATFAGGCFWCVEVDFQKVDGVTGTVSGFMGGTLASPTYQQVSRGGTGHAEVVQITFDPAKVSYERLVYIFWRTIDPLDAGGQFCDRGDSYRTAIFTHSGEQQKIATASKAALEASGRFKAKIATQIQSAGPFTAADDYHQNFHVKSPGRYASYRAGCGRDARVRAVWGAEAGGK